VPKTRTAPIERHFRCVKCDEGALNADEATQLATRVISLATGYGILSPGNALRLEELAMGATVVVVDAVTAVTHRELSVLYMGHPLGTHTLYTKSHASG